jgi:hypothetical protein
LTFISSPLYDFVIQEVSDETRAGDRSPHAQRIEISEAVMRWSRGQEFAVENVLIEQHNHVRLQHYVNRLVREPERMSQLVLTAPNGNRRPF